jgi:hypothetical protein
MKDTAKTEIVTTIPRNAKTLYSGLAPSVSASWLFSFVCICLH